HICASRRPHHHLPGPFPTRRSADLLTRAGLDACRQAGVEAVVVLGHPAYYPRFGFSAAAAEVLAAPFSGPAFMALELAPGALRRSEEHTSELQSRENLVCRLLLEKK